MVIPDIFGTAANYKTGVMQNLARQCTGDAGLCKKGFCHPEVVFVNACEQIHTAPSDPKAPKGCLWQGISWSTGRGRNSQNAEVQVQHTSLDLRL